MEKIRKCHQIIETNKHQEYKTTIGSHIWEDSQYSLKNQSSNKSNVRSTMVGGSEWFEGGSKWGCGQVAQAGMPQGHPSPPLQQPSHQGFYYEHDVLDESHTGITSVLAVLNDDETADYRLNVSQGSIPRTNNNNNNSLYNYNNGKPLDKLNMLSSNSDLYPTSHQQPNVMPAAQDLLYNKTQFNHHFNTAEHNDNFINDAFYNKTRDSSSYNNGYKQETTFNGNKQDNYNRYSKQFQDWQQLSVGNGSHDILPPSLQPISQHQHCSNGDMSVWPPQQSQIQSEVEELSPSVLFNCYQQLEEAQKHPPTILDIMSKFQRQEREVPIMNTSIPPPPLPQSRPRATRLADNKPFPAYLEGQVCSSAPAQHRSAMPQHQPTALPPAAPRPPSVAQQRAEALMHHQQQQAGYEEAVARHFSNMAMHESRNSMQMFPGQEHMFPPTRCYSYLPAPFFSMRLSHPPPSHIFPTPGKENLCMNFRKLTSSQRLHAHLEVCYDQFRQLEKERKQTEARLASCLPGRHWSSANTLPVPKLPPNPTRVDRLIIDNIREHCRLLTLVGKMENLGAYKVPPTVHKAISHWKTTVQRVEEARRAELEAHKFNHNNLVLRRATCIDEAKMEEKLEALVTSIRQLFAGIRGARTACWATLTCTVLSVREQQDTAKTEGSNETASAEMSAKSEVKLEETKQEKTQGN